MSKKIFSTMISFLIGGAMVFGQGDDMPQAVKALVSNYENVKKKTIADLEKLKKSYEVTKDEKKIEIVKAEIEKIKGAEEETEIAKALDAIDGNEVRWISKDATFELSSVHTSNSEFLTGEKFADFNICTKGRNDTGENGWGKIDLGKVFDISKIEVFNRNNDSGRIINAEISISYDGKKWTKLETLKKNSPQYVFTYKNKKAQYIKIQCNNNDGFLNLKFCKIYGK